MPDLDGLIALYGQGRFADVATQAAEWVAKEPANGMGWKVLGTARQQVGKLDAALAALQTAASLLPGDFETWNNLAAVLRDRGDCAAAEAAARRALALAPDAALVRLNLGLILNATGAFAEAAIHLALAPAGDPLGRFALGTALRKLDRLDEAASAFAQAAALNPNFAAAALALGSCLHAMGRTGEAVESLRRAVALDPKGADANGTLGLALLELGQIREGLARLEAGYGVVRFERNRGVSIHPGAAT